ncbi:MAG: bacteriophage abortive infection AbiH family protein [Clostridia bacterium]|nr:bacteriophage abortive infection AbiH family protein [Clostridia bacterium]
MNVTFLIGNGFDLNLGLKTRFRDFYDYYLKQESPNRTVKAFKEELSENLENWSDLEIVLGQYASNFNKSSEKKFISLLDDIQDSLADYIDKEDVEFTIAEGDRKKIYSDLFAPETYLTLREQESFLAYKKQFIATHWYIDAVVFNYTKAFERVLSWNGKQLNISTRIVGSSSLSNVVKSIEHIHGTTSSDMILGVNDSSQINNEQLGGSTETVRAMVKTEININAGTLRDRRCTASLEKADLICIYGMSLGDTDRYWWQTIAKKLKSSNTRLIIFAKSGEITARRSYRSQNIKDAIINTLLSHSNLTEDEKLRIGKQIFVCLNSNMFKATIILPEKEISKPASLLAIEQIPS